MWCSPPQSSPSLAKVCPAEERAWRAAGSWQLVLAWGKLSAVTGAEGVEPAWSSCAGMLGRERREVCQGNSAAQLLGLDLEVGAGVPAPVLKGAKPQGTLLAEGQGSSLHSPPGAHGSLQTASLLSSHVTATAEAVTLPFGSLLPAHPSARPISCSL